MIDLEIIDTPGPLTTLRAVCTLSGRTITERTYDASKGIPPTIHGDAELDALKSLEHEAICTKEKPCEPTC